MASARPLDRSSSHIGDNESGKHFELGKHRHAYERSAIPQQYDGSSMLRILFGCGQGSVIGNVVPRSFVVGGLPGIGAAVLFHYHPEFFEQYLGPDIDL